ncbi:hypothetical protein CERZMDRAFT_81723 [Cercospora zeae-maydis SCOH1-5]|uniref:Uncharacterized protein n=1 Tax=Cercospora zeae-maydis SCOH1-5 TaxID=717836 RepID=A0A6A6FQ23_9PEZI|nr:hypothetical protein CERZMDRAFT_81723 [Cercospora zeae-maydis SCOH1-5]
MARARRSILLPFTICETACWALDARDVEGYCVSNHATHVESRRYLHVSSVPAALAKDSNRNGDCECRGFTCAMMQSVTFTRVTVGSGCVGWRELRSSPDVTSMAISTSPVEESHAPCCAQGMLGQVSPVVDNEPFIVRCVFETEEVETACRTALYGIRCLVACQTSLVLSPGTPRGLTHRVRVTAKLQYSSGASWESWLAQQIQRLSSNSMQKPRLFPQTLGNVIPLSGLAVPDWRCQASSVLNRRYLQFWESALEWPVGCCTISASDQARSTTTARSESAWANRELDAGRGLRSPERSTRRLKRAWSEPGAVSGVQLLEKLCLRPLDYHRGVRGKTESGPSARDCDAASECLRDREKERGIVVERTQDANDAAQWEVEPTIGRIEQIGPRIPLQLSCAVRTSRRLLSCHR